MIGADADPVMLGLACSYAGIDWLRVELQCPPWPLDSGSADLVTAFAVLHMVPDEAQLGFLTEVVRVLRPGGLFIDHDFTGSAPGRLGRVLDRVRQERARTRLATAPDHRVWYAAAEDAHPGLEKQSSDSGVPARVDVAWTTSERLERMRAAGFSDARVVTQDLDGALLMAVR